MYRFRRTVLFAVLMGFFTAIPGVFAESFIGYIEGEVTVVRGSQQMEGEIGLSLVKGDTVVTGAGALAVLELEERGTLKLRESTTLVLSDLGDDMSVTLTGGGLFSRIRRLARRNFDVRTPNVVAAVRGTEFFVAYGRTVEDTPDLWLCVNEGTVEVALEDSGDSVLVNEGEGINVLAGAKITEPQFYAWTQDLNWNTDPDSGSLRDDADLDGAYSDLRDFDYD